MEILIEFGSENQKKEYLYPLLEGKIRSCFAMTEPEFPGSNPVKMGTIAIKKGGNYLINGHKWFTSGFDGASFAIVMLITNPNDNNPYKKASQIIVPSDNKGIDFIRNVSVMGHPGSGWESHAEIKFKNAIVPCSNILGDEPPKKTVNPTNFDGAGLKDAMQKFIEFRNLEGLDDLAKQYPVFKSIQANIQSLTSKVGNLMMLKLGLD